mmetsp:Transcript_35689/g.70218  ORF Transcript_35689/g.70218 Transcript_35689/m.70218 type:complete len:130 (-) Transcript_35689:15-404(-)
MPASAPFFGDPTARRSPVPHRNNAFPDSSPSFMPKIFEPICSQWFLLVCKLRFTSVFLVADQYRSPVRLVFAVFPKLLREKIRSLPFLGDVYQLIEIIEKNIVNKIKKNRIKQVENQAIFGRGYLIIHV